MKKGALGLSINTLVIIIISIVILSGGITLLYKFISGAEDIKNELDQKTQDELERLLVNQGKKVALPLHVADIERGNTHLFGLGILNTLGSKEDFFIKIVLKKVVDDSEMEIEVDKEKVVTDWLFYNNRGILISDGAHHKESILVNVPKNAVKGQYIFTAYVKTKTLEGNYGNPQAFYVNVR